MVVCRYVGRSLKIMGHFMYREIHVFKKNAYATFLNNLLLPLSVGLVFGYVMPFVGLKENYAGFIVIGCLINIYFYHSFDAACELTSDFEQDKRIEYELTLPLYTTIVFFKHIVVIALRTLLKTVLLPFPCKLILGHCFSFVGFSGVKYCFVVVLVNLAFAAFSVCLSGAMRVSSIMDFRMRAIDPLFWLGGFTFPWIMLYRVTPFFAWLNLLNPVVHGMEAMRVVFFGQPGYVALWFSCFVLILELGIFSLCAQYVLRHRLDCIDD